MYEKSMLEWVNEFAISDFSKSKERKRIAKWTKCSIGGRMQELKLTIYPNGGNKPENEGYLSIVFETYEYQQGPGTKAKLASISYFDFFHCIVSVVDADGISRFPQSFGIDLQVKGFQSHFPIEMDSFLKRRVLLDSGEELLPEDTLTLRCDIVCAPLKYQRTNNHKEEIRKIGENESWFIPGRTLDDGSKLLDLRNTDSPLCAGLKEQSEYFEAMFRFSGKEMEDGYMVIPISEFDTFFSMLGYIYSGNYLHMEDYEWDYFDLYKMANMYRVKQLQDMCSAYIKRHLTRKHAIKTLRDANSCSDADLRTHAFRHILSNWESLQGFIELPNLSFERPELSSELLGAAKILNLEQGTSGTLFDLAAREVLLEFEMVQQFPTWPIFAKKAPDWAKVILCLVNETLCLHEGYQEHTLDYKFYR